MSRTSQDREEKRPCKEEGKSGRRAYQDAPPSACAFTPATLRLRPATPTRLRPDAAVTAVTALPRITRLTVFSFRCSFRITSMSRARHSFRRPRQHLANNPTVQRVQRPREHKIVLQGYHGLVYFQRFATHPTRVSSPPAAQSALPASTSPFIIIVLQGTSLGPRPHENYWLLG